MKLSVSSYSFIQYIKAGKLSYIDCVDKAAEIGFDAIEFIDLDGTAIPRGLENLKKTLAKFD